jgi:hypothetical protein
MLKSFSISDRLKNSNFQITKLHTYFTFTKVIQINNGSTTKLYDFLILYFGLLIICIVVTTLFTNLIHLSYDFMKLYRRYTFFQKNSYT